MPFKELQFPPLPIHLQHQQLCSSAFSPPLPFAYIYIYANVRVWVLKYHCNSVSPGLDGSLRATTMKLDAHMGLAGEEERMRVRDSKSARKEVEWIGD